MVAEIFVLHCEVPSLVLMMKIRGRALVYHALAILSATLRLFFKNVLFCSLNRANLMLHFGMGRGKGSALKCYKSMHGDPACSAHKTYYHLQP